jgi:hypothetical protein
MTTEGKNRIMIYGPKENGTYVVEFRTAAGETWAISIPRTETAVIRHFQERMPYGLFVPPRRRKPRTPQTKNRPRRSGPLGRGPVNLRPPGGAPSAPMQSTIP